MERYSNLGARSNMMYEMPNKTGCSKEGWERPVDNWPRGGRSQPAGFGRGRYSGGRPSPSSHLNNNLSFGNHCYYPPQRQPHSPSTGNSGYRGGRGGSQRRILSAPREFAPQRQREFFVQPPELSFAEKFGGFKVSPTFFPEPLRRPYQGCCCECLPKSTNIAQNELVVSALDKLSTENASEERIEGERASLVYKVNKILEDMKASISVLMIRLTGYVLYHVFNRLFTSVTVHRGQLQVLQQESQRHLPLIYVPLHRSHIDYLMLTWVLFVHRLAAPLVAAGDNLRMPVFGWTLRSLGGFFIKRRLESCKSQRDLLYRAVLQTYMTNALQLGYGLEFFLEGGRTRSGKPGLPKGGLLSVIVDAYRTGALDDALIVPMAISYDKLVDGNFVNEQLGRSKVLESFWGAVSAIWRVFSTNYGHTRVDFGQPFSLREFVASGGKFPLAKSSERNLASASSSDLGSCGYESQLGKAEPLHSTQSTSSLFGATQNDEFRHLVSSLGAHILYDSERCQAVMSTAALAYLLSFTSREGATLACLSRSLDVLKKTLNRKGRDVGFSGDSKDVILCAAHLLGSFLVNIEMTKSQTLKEDESSKIKENSEASEFVFLRPLVSSVPSAIELNYYASALSPTFAVDAIVATALNTLVECDMWSYRDCGITNYTVNEEKLMERSLALADLLEYEFILTPPCVSSRKLRFQDAIQELILLPILVDTKPSSNQCRGGFNYNDSSSDEDYEYQKIYKLTFPSETLETLQPCLRMLTPILDAYHCVCLCLQQLLTQPPIDEKLFVRAVQDYATTAVQEQRLLYAECVAVDPIRNAMRKLEKWGVLEAYSHESLRLVYLSHEYDSKAALNSVLGRIDVFRK